MLSATALRQTFTNVVYIGHWVRNGVIIKRHNHEAIIPHDLFMYAFNRLSRTDFNGDPNPRYVAQRPWTRHLKEDREADPPNYSGALFVAETTNAVPRRATSHYHTDSSKYHYILRKKNNSFLRLNADRIDELIDEILVKRLRATTIDDEAWQKAVESARIGQHVDVRRVENAIRGLEQTQRSIVENLKSVAHPDLVKQLEDSYIANEQEMDRLHAELEDLQAEHTADYTELLDARPVLETVIKRWQDVEREYRRELFDALADRVVVIRLDKFNRGLTVHWRDGSVSAITFHSRDSEHRQWTEEDLEKLKLMIERQADQVDILRAFANHTWRNIRERYAYHFGGWRGTYHGKVKYPFNTRWTDTNEYRALPQQARYSLPRKPHPSVSNIGL